MVNARVAIHGIKKHCKLKNIIKNYLKSSGIKHEIKNYEEIKIDNKIKI